MHPHFADGTLPLQVGVGLTLLAVTPRRQRLFCSGTLCGRGYGGWFSPSTGQRSGQYVHPVAAGPSELLLYRHAQDHRLLTRDILGYPSLFGDVLGLSTRRFLSIRGSRIAGTPVYWALGSLRLFEFQCEALSK